MYFDFVPLEYGNLKKNQCIQTTKEKSIDGLIVLTIQNKIFSNYYQIIQ